MFADKYNDACDKIAFQRAALEERLSKISYLKVYPSQANYVMCKVIDKYQSKELANYLIRDYNILIKDLSEKNGFNGEQYIRLAVKDEEENNARCV